MDLIDKEVQRSEIQSNPRTFSITNSRSLQDNIDHVHRLEGIPTGSTVTVAQISEACSPSPSAVPSRKPSTQDLEKKHMFSSRIDVSRRPCPREDSSGNADTKNRDIIKSLPVVGREKSPPVQLENPEQYVVEFDGPDDPMHPLNWPDKKKLLTVIILGVSTTISVFTSSMFSAVSFEVSKQFHVANEVGLLGLSLYVLGFAFGPLIWAPLSELKGRRPTLVWPIFGLAVLQAGVASGKDLQTILICRFWSGTFGAAPLAVVAAVFTDIYEHRVRGVAISFFSMTVFAGPLVAPSIGGLIIESHLGWRWTQWIIVILSFISFFVNLLFLNETYPPIILVSKAVSLRHKSRNWTIHAKQEEIDTNFRLLLTQNFSRPLRLLFTEPIILLISIYMSFVYGLLYLFLTSYPLVFQKLHGMSPAVGGLPFFGMVLGIIAGGLYVIISQSSYNRKLSANNGIPVPEWRLPPMITGSIAFSIGLFWFSWTGYKSSIHWIVPSLSGVLTGFGILIIFLQSLNYLLDTYLIFAASAVASVTTLRSLAGAGFPLFSQVLFNALGINWGGTILGCIATALIPIPIIFYRYGERIRGKSSFSSKLST